jgi:hypothetical protein
MMVFFLGCSSTLTVQVDIFDSKGFNPEDVLKASVEREIAQHFNLVKKGAYARTRSDLKIQLNEYLALLSKPEIAVVAHDDLAKFSAKSVKIIDSEVNEAVRKRNEGIKLARRAETSSKADERQKSLESAQEKFTSARDTLNLLKAEFLRPYQGLLQQTLSSMNAEVTPDLTAINDLILSGNIIDRKVEKSVQKLSGGLDLFDDPMAPFVISASENYWKGVFNKTKASGQIGNTDIAIKMETIGTFTIKGVRLDAAKVTEASFQVLKQSVKLVAAAYGIPTPGGTPPPVGDPAAETPNEIVMNIDKLRQFAELKRHKSRYAAYSLLDLIIAEHKALVSDDASIREGAVSRVKKSFEAYKAQLSGG